MLVEFIEVSQQDNRPLGVVFINPRHVVKVTRAATDPDKPVAISLIQDVNKGTTRVDGGPSTVMAALQRGDR